MSFRSGDQISKCLHSEVQINVCQDLAEIKLIQRFAPPQNPEGEYLFQLLEDSSIAQLVIRTGQTTIVAEVHDKETALTSYSDTISQGRSAYVGLKTSDQFAFFVGNLEKSEPFEVELLYVNHTSYSRHEQAWTLQIPKYLFAGTPSSFCINFNTQSPINILEYEPFSIEKPKPNRAILTNDRITKDVHIKYSCENNHLCSVFVQKDMRTGRKAAYLSYLPQIIEASLSDWDPYGEFIILLDRSGSMGGLPMELAIEAVNIFIKSLPMNSFFNIISFGSSHQKMFEESSPYSAEAIGYAQSQLSKMRANLGGTEILQPLKKALSTNTKPTHPLYVFLVTDGQVTNNLEIIDYVKSHSGKAMVNAIGIGSGVDTKLIHGVADAGNGHWQLIREIKEIKSTIISVLKSALVPGLTDIKITNPQDFALVDERPFYAHSGGRIHLGAVLLNNESPVLKMSYRDEFSSRYVDIEFDLALVEESCGSAALVMAVGKAIKNMESNRAKATSIEYQVLCEETALLGIKKLNCNPNKRMIIPCCANAEDEAFDDLYMDDFDDLSKEDSDDLYTEDFEINDIELSEGYIMNKEHEMSAKIDTKTGKYPNEMFRSPNNPIGNISASEEEALMNIISLQDIDGHWEMSTELEKLLRKELGDLFDNSQPVTRVVLTLLVNHFANQKDTWELIAGKANRWLKLNNFEPIIF